MWAVESRMRAGQYACRRADHTLHDCVPCLWVRAVCCGAVGGFVNSQLSRYMDMGVKMQHTTDYSPLPPPSRTQTPSQLIVCSSRFARSVGGSAAHGRARSLQNLAKAARLSSFWRLL